MFLASSFNFIPECKWVLIPVRFTNTEHKTAIPEDMYISSRQLLSVVSHPLYQKSKFHLPRNNSFYSSNLHLLRFTGELFNL